MNKIMLVGRVVKDPSTFQTNLGIKYTRFRLAVNRPFSRNQSDFIPVIAWRSQAEFVEKYLKKGALVSIEGWFTSSVFQNKNNEVVVNYEITVDNISSLESRQTIEARQQSKTQELQLNIDLNDKQPTSAKKAHDLSNQTQEEKSFGTNQDDVPWDLDL